MLRIIGFTFVLLLHSVASADDTLNVGQWRAINTSVILTRMPYSLYWKDFKLGYAQRDGDRCCYSRDGQLRFLRPNRRDQRTVPLDENETYALYHEGGQVYLGGTGWSKEPLYIWKIQLLGTRPFQVPPQHAADSFRVPSVAFRLYHVGAKQYLWLDLGRPQPYRFTCSGPMLPSANVAAMVRPEDGGGSGVGSVGCYKPG